MTGERAERGAIDRGVDAVTDVIRLGIRPFAAPPGQPRTRRATDLVVLVPSLLALAILVAAYPPSALEQALIRLLAALPHWLDPAWGFLADLTWFWALAVVLLAIVARRFSIAAQAAAAVAVAAAIALVSARLAAGAWPDLAVLTDSSHAIDFPDVRLAVAVAVIASVSPHLVQPLRRTGHWIALLGIAGTAVTAGGTPGGALAAVLLGLVAASIVNLAFGTSAGRPGLAGVAAALAQLGVRADGLEEEERQGAGVVRLRATSPEGRPLLVKVYGRDAADNQLVARLWRRISYRSGGPAIGSSRLHAAEREAFVTLLVRYAGLPTRDVVTAGATAGDDALLVLSGEATSLDSLAAAQIGDELLDDLWRALHRLHDLHIAHQQIEPATVALLEDGVGFVDFGGATIAPDGHQLGVDRAQLLATTASLVDLERAVAAGIRAVGSVGIESLLPYVQGAALPPGLRRALKAASVDVDDLWDGAASAAGVEPPELAKLRRVSVRSAVQIALLGLASYTIISAASGVDWGEVRESVADASWGWIAVAFVVAQLPRVTQAVSTLGSVPTQLPFGPVYGMQLATGYMNVVLPSNLARLAVNIRFFQRQGLSPTTAVSAGAIDSFASTVIQAFLLAGLLLFSESSVELDVPLPSGDPRRLLWLLGTIVLGAVITLVAVRRIRTAITSRVTEWWPDVKATLAALRGSHKLAQLVLGSLGTEILFAIALGTFARAFGYDLSLAELLVINLSVSLLGSLVPVPGNIGVAEFGLTLGLTGAGMTPEAALGTVFLYRIATFYLPPLWGFVALRWLQRERYL